MRDLELQSESHVDPEDSVPIQVTSASPLWYLNVLPAVSLPFLFAGPEAPGGVARLAADLAAAAGLAA